MEPIDLDLEEGELELPAEPMHLNMGPSHPAMHGTLRAAVILDVYQAAGTVHFSARQVGCCRAIARLWWPV